MQDLINIFVIRRDAIFIHVDMTGINTFITKVTD